jgi:hypothetical protein
MQEDNSYIWYTKKILELTESFIPEESLTCINEYINFNEVWQAMGLILFHVNEQKVIDHKIWLVIWDFLKKYPTNWYDVQKHVEKELIEKILW